MATDEDLDLLLFCAPAAGHMSPHGTCSTHTHTHTHALCKDSTRLHWNKFIKHLTWPSWPNVPWECECPTERSRSCWLVSSWCPMPFEPPTYICVCLDSPTEPPTQPPTEPPTEPPDVSASMSDQAESFPLVCDLACDLDSSAGASSKVTSKLT